MKCKVTWFYWFIGVTIFCIDRITKNAALVSFIERTASGIPGLSYETTINRGFSWGLFHSSNFIVFTIVTLIIMGVTSLLISFMRSAHKQGGTIFGYVCVVAGSLSNIVDRICYGGVIDFIILSIGDYSWPVFNIADAAIVTGVMLVVWQQYMLTKE